MSKMIKKSQIFDCEEPFVIIFFSQRHLHHTPRTCETGPGNPSGHAMINIVLWYIIADAITSSKLVDNQLGEASRQNTTCQCVVKIENIKLAMPALNNLSINVYSYLFQNFCQENGMEWILFHASIGVSFSHIHFGPFPTSGINELNFYSGQPPPN